MTQDERNQLIAQKLNEGMSLADVQRYLASEHQIVMTYLDLRLLAAELQVDWRQHDPVKAVEKTPDAAEPADADLDLDQETPAAAGGNVKVSIHKVVRPGAAMSGDVQFASGVTAEWYVDSYGRLGLSSAKGGRPSEEDLQEFQVELQRQLSGRY